MKEVKALIADSQRPVEIEFQSLRLIDGEALSPPYNKEQEYYPLSIWKKASSSWSLEFVGEEETIEFDF